MANDETTEQTVSQSSNTSDSCEQTCTFPDPLPSPPIIDTILSDVNAIIPNFSSLVSSYRLLVGASEEIHRMPEVCPDVYERAVRRFDNTGTLIDILIDLLCCKIAYSSEFLGITCAPIDLFRLIGNSDRPCDESHITAEQIITLEALRKILSNCLTVPCLPQEPVVCPPKPSIVKTEPEVPPQQPPVNPLRRRHI